MTRGAGGGHPGRVSIHVAAAVRRAGALLLAGLLSSPGAARAGEDPPAPPSTRPILTPQQGHPEGVRSAVFSPDGAFVLTAGDRSACLWEAATGAELRRLVGHQEIVLSAVFSPDGTQVLTASADRTARLWDPTTGRELRRFEGHARELTCASFAPDGSRVLTASLDGSARLWEASTGRELGQLRGHEGGVTSAVFSADAARVLTTGIDRTVRTWEAASGRELHKVVVPIAPVKAAVFTPDATHVLAVLGGGAFLCDATTGEVVRRFVGHLEDVSSVRLSRDGSQVLTASFDRTARRWDAATGRELQRFEGHLQRLRTAEFSPDGTEVLTASADGTARVWDAQTGRETRRFAGRAEPTSGAVFAYDGTHLLTTGGEVAHLWDLVSGQETRRFRRPRRPLQRACFTRDGAFLLTSGGPEAQLWETATGKEVRTFRGHTDIVLSAALSADGMEALTASADRTARLWSLADGREVRRFEGHTAWVTSAEFAPNGVHVATGSMDGDVRLWDRESGARVRTIPTGTQVACVAFSPDGGRLLAACYDGSARLWETSSGTLVRSYLGHASAIRAAVFSPDGARILTTSADGTARLWDAESGRELQRLPLDSPWELATFSPDGSRVLATSARGAARLWDAATGRESCSLLSFADGGWAVTDPQGRYDASAAGAVDGLHWVIGMEAIALDQLKARYYEPGLLAKHLGRDPGSLRDVEALAAPRLHPEVRVRRTGQRVEIALRNRGGGIGRVVVLVNGKERTADARGPEADPRVPTLLLEQDLGDDPRLLPGASNRIEVFAYNEEGYLSSRGVTLDLPQPGETRPPSLWAVVAGVSAYRGAALRLRFAAQDARDFATALRLASTSLFGAERTHVALLTDAEARRQALVDAFADAGRAEAGDILVVYLAGHGVSTGDGFYYLTADAASTDLGDPAVRDASTLSSTELGTWISRIPALKQVLVLDTCAAGRLIEDLTGRRSVDAGQVRALERVKDRTGMFILAGCASDRVSYEATPYGQGLLTYSLLLGMRGGQLRANEFVDVATLFHYAADRVPEFAKDVGGVQRPLVAVPRGGASFDIGRLTAEDRSQVPHHGVRPLFVRAMLLDDDAGADLLALSQGVSDALEAQGAAGRDGAPIFVDVPAFPGGYLIAGKYVSHGRTTTARFRLHKDRAPLTDWIEVSGEPAVLPARIVEAARDRLPAPGR